MDQHEALPKNVRPRNYHLTLTPNFETFKFSGEEVIEVDVNEDSTSIARFFFLNSSCGVAL